MVAPLLAGRYRLYEPIASGGMATVHFGRQVGEAGFARTIAIKRVHPKHFGKGAMVSGLVDEARLASRIQHPNVVPTLDVFQADGELFVVMEFVMGETLARLQRVHMDRGEPMPVPIALSIAIGMLQGLHAAHEAKNERGQPLSIVHRDVSPQNVLVGVDGLARVLDFGIAKAEERLTSTLNGQVKGKPRYMAPEQIRAENVTRRTDIFAAGIVIWESLAGKRLYESDAEVVVAYSERKSPDPAAKHNPNVPAKVDAVLRRALVFDADDRFEDAATFALALEEAGDVASPRRVSEWVKSAAGASLRERAEMIAGIERESSRDRVLSDAQAEETKPELEPASPPARTPTARVVSSGPHDDSTRIAPLPDAVTVVGPPPGAGGVGAPESDAEARSSGDDSLESSTLEVQPRAPSVVAPPETTPAPEAERERPKRHAFTGLLVALVALLAGGVAALIVYLPATGSRNVAEPSATPRQIAPTAIATIQPVLEPIAEGSGTSIASSSTSTPSSAPLATTEAVPSTTRVRSFGHAPSAGVEPRSAQPLDPQPKPADPCSPPFVIDKNNVKRFKPECL